MPCPLPPVTLPTAWPEQYKTASRKSLELLITQKLVNFWEYGASTSLHTLWLCISSLIYRNRNDYNWKGPARIFYLTPHFIEKVVRA